MSLSVRAGAIADHAVYARLFVELGVDDPIPPPERFAQSMLPRVVVVQEDGRALGCAHWQTYGATAHVVHVIVDPGARGRGAGRALMDAVRERVVAEGATRWYLNVKRDNAPAIRLYERCGLRPELESWAVRFRWDRVSALPASDAGPAHALPPGDDAEVAASFGVPVERLGIIRGRPGTVLVAVREGSTVVAFAAFDPAYPGAYPFRATRGELARTLLEALRPHAREERGDLLLVAIEGDRHVYEALMAAGGELRHEIVRMSADLAPSGGA